MIAKALGAEEIVSRECEGRRATTTVLMGSATGPVLLGATTLAWRATPEAARWLHAHALRRKSGKRRKR